MAESNLSHCKLCGQLKVRTEAGKFPGSENKRFVDDNGDLWNGRKCPQCHKLNIRKGMNLLRAKDKT